MFVKKSTKILNNHIDNFTIHICKMNNKYKILIDFFMKEIKKKPILKFFPRLYLKSICIIMVTHFTNSLNIMETHIER